MGSKSDLRFGQGSKRSACDRCRDQKLRCLRGNGDNEPCTRCFRANVTCLTGPALPTGRPPRTAATLFKLNEVDRIGHKRRLDVSESADPAMRTNLGPNTVASQSNTSISTPTSIPHQSEETHHTNNRDANHQTLLSDADKSANPSLDSPLLSSTDMEISTLFSPGTEHMFWTQMETSDQYNMLIQDSADLDFSSLSRSENFRSNDSGDPNRPNQTPLRWADTPAPTPPQTMGLDVPGNEQHNDQYLNVGQTDQISSHASKDSQGVSSSRPENVKSKSHYLHQLSYLNLSIYQELAYLERKFAPVTLVTLICPIPEDCINGSNPVDNILKYSQQFLDVLHFLKPLSTTKSSETPSSSKSDSGDPSTGDIETTDVTSTTSINTSLNMDINSSTNVNRSVFSDMFSKRSQDTMISSTGTPEFKTPVILLIISCYLQLVRSYGAVFKLANAHFSHQIQSGMKAFIEPIDHLRFSSFALQNGNLQVLIFIQIVTHLFEGMEEVLGLPAEYRISGREEAYSEGILGSTDKLKLFQTVIDQESLEENDISPSTKTDIIKSLRDDLVSVKKMMST